MLTEKYNARSARVEIPNLIRPRRLSVPEFEQPPRRGGSDNYAPRLLAPPPGMETAPVYPRDATPGRLIGMKVRKINLAATFTDVPLTIVGNVLWVPYSTNAADLLFIRPNALSDYIPATRGWFLAGVGFDGVNGVLLTNPTAVGGAFMYLAYTYDESEEKVRIL